MEDSNSWMTGSSHNENSEYLTVHKVRNNKIQDFRHIENLERLSFDLSVYDTNILSAQNKIRSLKSDNISLKGKEGYFSDAFLTKDFQNNIQLMFAVDYKKIIMDSSVYKKLYQQLSIQVDELISKSRIKSLSLKRRQVSGNNPNNKLGSSLPGGELFSDNTIVETIAISQHSSAGSFTESKNEISGIKEEMPNIQQLGIKFFSGFDKSLSNFNAGKYQYGVEIVVEDGATTYLKEKLDDLIERRKSLQEYYENGTKLGISKYLTEISDPHIDHIWERESEITKSSGNYNPILNRFTDNFIIEEEDNFSVAAAMGIYFKILELFATIPQEVKDNIEEMVMPKTGNPKGVLAFIRAYDNLIANLNNLLGLTSDSRSMLTKPTVYEYWLADGIVDISEPKNIGYDYLSKDMSEAKTSREYIRSFTFSKYLNRLKIEAEKYYTSETPNLSIDDSYYSSASSSRHGFPFKTTDNIGAFGSAFLSPRYCHFNKKANNVSLIQYNSYSALAAEILSYNSYKKDDPTSVETFKSASTSLYSNINVTIEPTGGRNVPEGQENKNGPIDHDADTNTLSKFLLTKFIKTGATNNESNNPFDLNTDTEEDLGIAMWNSSKGHSQIYSSKNIYSYMNMGDTKKHSIITSCGWSLSNTNSPTSRQALKVLPNQLKSLITLSPIKDQAKWDWTAQDSDPTKGDKSAFFHFRYNMINSVEYLVGFDDALGDARIKKPIWNPLIKERAYDALTGGAILCRLRPFECPTIGIKQPKGLKLPVYDNYFIIKGSN